MNWMTNDSLNLRHTDDNTLIGLATNAFKFVALAETQTILQFDNYVVCHSMIK